MNSPTPIKFRHNYTPSRLIITDRGQQVSNELRNEILSSIDNNGNNNKRLSGIDSLPPSKRFAALSMANLPQGYTSQLQSQVSVSMIRKPFHQSGLSNSGGNLLFRSTNFNSNNNNNSSLGQNIFGAGKQNLNSKTNGNRNDLENVLSGLNDPMEERNRSLGIMRGSGSNPALLRVTTTSMGTASSLLGGMNSTGKDFNRTQFSSNNSGLFLSNNNSQPSSTKRAVENRQAWEKMVSVQSLGGLKINVRNVNYMSEVNAQTAMQREQINQVQRERFAKKYNDWNEQFVKHNELMKHKYYEKQEDIGKLGDKEDEDFFWKQWRSLKDSCSEAIDLATKQNARFEERVIAKINSKYRTAFKNLPACAKTPSNLNKSPKSQQQQQQQQQSQQQSRSTSSANAF